MSTDEGFSGVSNCYVFKSRLQEYAQKVGLPTPVYETIKEGPSHEPSFRSTVIVKDARYYSLPGFFNRKAAEQSAAEVALVELAKAGEIDESISQPVHETGLCKNLLQEYAQKMNYAIPLYDCQKDETPGRGPIFKCTVEIGGIQYIGASAKTKKEAEIKAARTALLAIQASASDRPIDDAQLTVIPCRKRGVGTSIPEETAKVPKAKKARFKKKMLKKKLSEDRIDNVQSELTHNLDVVDSQLGSESVHIDGSSIRGASCGPLATGATRKFQDEMSGNDLNEREASDVTLTYHSAADHSESGRAMAPEFNQSNCGIGAGISSVPDSDMTNVTVVMEVASLANNSALAQIEASNA